MKKRITMALAMMLCLFGTSLLAQQNQTSTIKNTKEMTKENEKMTAILNAVELYAEAGRQGSREIGQKAFTEAATMSWVENGKITTVPITSLYEGLEQTGKEEVTYTVENINIAGNIAYVRISSWFSKLGSFDDMFTLAEQNGEWKIVSKIYHVQ